MQDFDPLSPRARQLTRRRFLASAGGGLFVLGAARNLSWAQSSTQTVLSGTQFNLDIGEIDVNITGNRRRGTVVNGQIPAPLLRWREGDTVTLRVSNRLPVSSSIHWHGMIVPADMDGVPGLSFDGIPSGGSYVYRFKVNQYGTYWYHAHSRFQEQTGLYGPIEGFPGQQSNFLIRATAVPEPGAALRGAPVLNSNARLEVPSTIIATTFSADDYRKRRFDGYFGVAEISVVESFAFYNE